MPAIVSSFRLQTYRQASEIPRDVLLVLRKDPRSNILLAGIEKAIIREMNAIPAQYEEFWILLYTERSGPLSFDFVLSCTHGVIGEYPIFIHSTRTLEALNDDFLEPRMYRLVQELDSNVSTHRRVYSIFALRPISLSFARHWTQRTRIRAVPEPYYEAKFSYCDLDSLALPPSPNPSCIIRLAEENDVLQVAQLCNGFSQESPPFVLDDDGALREANTLISAKQVWVLEVMHNMKPTVACIVALTRTTSTVAAVTKVYTPPRFRQRGFARRLVRHVTNELLDKEKKQCVVLYVGNGNPAAHVYHRVGFKGLDPEDANSIPMVEPWLELGFDRNQVDLGQW